MPHAPHHVFRAAILGLVAAVSCDHAPTAPDLGPLPARRLIGGETTACAIDDAGTVRCWGFASSYFEYGSTSAGGYAPSVASVPALTAVARGSGPHFCGIGAGGAAICWGRGGFGQLGRGYVESTGNAAAAVTGGYAWSSIAVGRLITCGITVGGAGFCWGLDQFGEVGNADTLLGVRVTSPYPLGDSLTWQSIAAGWVHACGLAPDGTAYCWGRNDYGQLGIGTTDTLRHRPTRVAANLAFARIAAGSRYTCGITTDGSAYCWGANATGQLGDGTSIIRTTPTAVAGGHRFTDIVASSGFADGAIAAAPAVGGTFGHTCALDAGGHAWCWGWNGSGELGVGTRADQGAPIAVAGGRAFDVLIAGGAFTCGMRGSYVWCWGSNLNGQLGAGINDFMALEPVRVGAPFRAQ